MQVEYEETQCPICTSDQATRLLPSAKRLSDIGEFRVSDTVFLVCCDRCGTVFESPRIKAESHADYSTRAYYNELNSAWLHDDLQHVWARYNWAAVKDALPWSSLKRVVDVGAAGAWANHMLETVPGIVESTLVEPSREAIFNAEMRYPALKTVCDIFESWNTEDGTVDLVNFLNSFYSISEPRTALAKVNRVLSPDGWLIVSFSYAAAELAHWQGGKPWNTLSHLIRGVPQVYYSRRTFEKLLTATGFSVHKNIVVTIPDSDPLGMSGRQLMFVVAQKSGEAQTATKHDSLSDPGEISWAHDYYLNFCRKASQKSVDLFLLRRKPGSISVVCGTDPAFNSFLENDIDWHGQSPRFLKELSADNAAELENTEDHWILVADDRDDLKELQKCYSLARVVHACPPPGYDGFGFSITGPTGAPVITRSFCPDYEVGDDVFAADIRSPGRTIVVEENERREPLPAPHLISSVPWLAARISQYMQDENSARTARLVDFLIPILQRGITEKSLAVEALGQTAAQKVMAGTKTPSDTNGCAMLKDYRAVQQILVFCTGDELQTVEGLLE